jgi:hypothetical protein
MQMDGDSDERGRRQVREQIPVLADQLTAVVRSAVIVFEVVGPILARTALRRAGEVTTTPTALRLADAPAG